jgi:hypothetical protein
MGKHRLTDGYRITGYKSYQIVFGLPEDPQARVIKTKRIQKKLFVRNVEANIDISTTKSLNSFEIFPVAI